MSPSFIDILLRKLVPLLLCFSLAQCTGGRGSAPSPAASGTGVGNPEVYGGEDKARELVKTGVQDLSEAYRLLAQRPALASDLCSETCPPNLDGTVCDLLTKAGSAQRARAKSFILDAAADAAKILRRPDAELITIVPGELTVDGRQVNARTAVGPDGPIEIAGNWFSAASNLNQLDRILGHELHHKVYFRGGAAPAYLIDHQAVVDYDEEWGAEHLLSVVGACLASFAEKHNYKEYRLLYAARGSGAVGEVRFRRGTDETVTIATSFALLGAVAGREAGESFAAAGADEICADGTIKGATPCGTPWIRDTLVKDGERYFLDAGGGIFVQSTGAVVYRNPRVTGFAFSAERWFLLTSDGTVWMGSFLDDKGGDLAPMPVISLPFAARLLMGGGI